VWILLLVTAWRLLFPHSITAAPYFFFSGTSSGTFKELKAWDLMLNTNGQLLTAVQAVVSFDGELFNEVKVSNVQSRCSFWSPPDPSLGLGNGVTPFFINGEKIVVACGFSNPGYNTNNGVGDRILSFTLEPYYLGTSTFSISDVEMRFVDAVINPGISLDFEYAVISSEAATPSPTPVPTPTPVPPTPTTLRASDLTTFNMLASRSGSTAMNYAGFPTGSDSAVPQASSLDDAIPPPPDNLEQRPPATPYPALEQNQLTSADNGEVLSIQSLRELLIPGKSDADRRLVVFNLVIIIIFLILLAMLVWRLILAKRAHDLKIKHMNELIEGELSVIQGKVQAVDSGVGSSQDVMQSLEDLKRELDQEAK
jgi:hypothetical protein